MKRVAALVLALIAAACESSQPTSPTPTPQPLPPPPFNVQVIGAVADAESALPLERASVRMRWPSATGAVTTDADGRYDLRVDVQPPVTGWWGPGSLVAEKDGYEPNEQYTAVPRGGTATLDFRLRPIVRIAAGDSTRLEIDSHDTYCSLDDWWCRTVRITPPAAGTLTLEVLPESGVLMGLEVVTRPYVCCPSTASLSVTDGELRINVLLLNVRRLSGPEAFTLKTAFTTR